MLIIWKALVTYLDNNLRQGKSINIRKFGAFTYDIATELPKLANRTISSDADLFAQRATRKHVHHLKAVFVVDKDLQSHLIRYKGKEEITPARSQRSIYQQGFRMVYANPVPIAAACSMGKDVVNDTLNTIFLAIKDLIKQDYNISLQFGFANVQFNNRNLKTYFASHMTRELSDKDFENRMRRMNSPVAQMWKTNTQLEFNKSQLGTLIKKPNHHVTEALMQKTNALRLMSLDMSSAAMHGKTQMVFGRRETQK